MAVIISLASDQLQAQPGGTATSEARLGNDGSDTVSVLLGLDGDVAAFAWILPAEVALAPGEEATVRFGFRLPPGSKPRAGPSAWQLRARTGPPASAVVATADGMLDVAPFTELSLAVNPVSATGTGPTTYSVSILNRGNAPAPVSLAASSPDADVDVAVEPATVVAEPGHQAAATITATPRRRVLTGPGRERSFTVAATTGGGPPVTSSGTLHQGAVLSAKAITLIAVVAVLAVVGVLLAVVTGGGGTKAATNAGAVNTDAGRGTTDAACPAKGHADTKANGLRPNDIPTLPDTYSFSQVQADGCTPVRWNPCEPIHYVVNAANAPPTGLDDVKEAFSRLGQATGITFVDDGPTDETTNQRGAANRRAVPYLPDRYGARWAPVLVQWTHSTSAGDIQIVGGGFPDRVGNVLVSGTLFLNVDAVTDAAKRTPIQGGFGPNAGSGVGAIGPEGVTWGRIILHELSHVMGLGHTRDRASLMYPETTSQTTRPVKFGAADLEGLSFLGKPAGCVPAPPLPA